MAASGNVPEWLVEQLMIRGLNRQSANSRTVEITAELLNTEDNKALLKLTREQCDKMVKETAKSLDEMRKTYNDLSEKVRMVSDTILAIKEAQEEYGEISDQKAKDALSLFATLLTVGEKYTGADVVGAGYMVYAYLGGQAARITYPYEPKETKIYAHMEGMRL